MLPLVRWIERVGDPAAPYLRRSRRVRGHMAAARQLAGGDAAPEETNDAADRVGPFPNLAGGPAGPATRETLHCCRRA